MLGRDRRGQAPAQVLQRAALAEPGPRNGPSSRSAIQWCHARSTWETSSAEPCRASSSPEKMAYSVSSVPAGSSLTNPSIRPQRRRISEGRRFSAGAPSASPTASPSSAPLARSLPTAVSIASPFARPAVGIPIRVRIRVRIRFRFRALSASVPRGGRGEAENSGKGARRMTARIAKAGLSSQVRGVVRQAWLAGGGRPDGVVWTLSKVVFSGERRGDGPPEQRGEARRGHHRDRSRPARGAPGQPHPPGCERRLAAPRRLRRDGRSGLQPRPDDRGRGRRGLPADHRDHRPGGARGRGLLHGGG